MLSKLKKPTKKTKEMDLLADEEMGEETLLDEEDESIDEPVSVGGLADISDEELIAEMKRRKLRLDAEEEEMDLEDDELLA